MSTKRFDVVAAVAGGCGLVLVGVAYLTFGAVAAVAVLAAGVLLSALWYRSLVARSTFPSDGDDILARVSDDWTQPELVWLSQSGSSVNDQRVAFHA